MFNCVLIIALLSDVYSFHLYMSQEEVAAICYLKQLRHLHISNSFVISNSSSLDACVTSTGHAATSHSGRNTTSPSLATMDGGSITSQPRYQVLQWG